MNNQAEALALFWGTEADRYKVSRIIVIVDSKIIIKTLRKGSGQSQSTLSRIILRISKEVASYEKVECYQVLKELNGKADSLANEASKLEQGVMRDNQGQQRLPIP